MAAGIGTSLALETILLRLGKDRLPWGTAARAACGMSLISMLAMESTENAVSWGLGAGLMSYTDGAFWMVTATSVAAGFLAPLPYNYLLLKLYGKACH